MKKLNELLNEKAEAPATDPEAKPLSPAGEGEPAEGVCPHCRGAGFVRRDVPREHPDFGRAFPCRCVVDEREEQRAGRLRRYSNLGPLTRLTFDNLVSRGRSANRRDQERYKVCVEDAASFAERPEGWLVISGPSGCGKTHIAAAVANRAIERGHPALFMVVPDLLDHLRAAYRPDSDITYDEFFEQVRNAPLLILDDLGTQTTTPWAQEKLFQVINHRFNAQLPTVVTTNVAIDRIEDRLRTRLTDPSLARAYQLPETQENDFWELDMLRRPMIQRMTFETFDTAGGELTERQRESLEAAFRSALAYAESPDRCIVIYGEANGCGKTHLAAAIANYRRQMGESPCFVRVADLLRYLRSTYDEGSPVTYDRAIQKVRVAPLLILDDFEIRARTPWVRETLFELVDYRFTNLLPTVVTTNLNRATLTMRDKNASDDVAERLATRLWDPTLCTDVEIEAPGYRVRLNTRGPERADRSGRPGRGRKQTTPEEEEP